MAVISKIKATADNVDYNIRDDYSIWGGRNYMQGTGNPYYGALLAPQWLVQSGGNGTGSIIEINDPPAGVSLTKVFRITGNTSGNRDFAQRFSNTAGEGPLCDHFGETFCFSAWVRSITDSNCTALVRSWNSTKGNAAFQKTFTVTPTWTYYHFDYITTSNSAAATHLLDWRFGITGAGSIEYIAPKLELGNKPTDWSPAPEDIARYIGDNTIELFG